MKNLRPSALIPEPTLRSLARFSLLALFFLFAAVSCPPTPLNQSGPSMVTVIQLGSPPPDTTANAIDLNAANVTKTSIPSGIKIRLISTITSDSPITNVKVNSNLTWQCIVHPSKGFPHPPPRNFTLAFMPPIPATPNSTTLKVDSVVHPIAMIPMWAKWGCTGGDITGFVSISATNSAGTSTSKTFAFGYNETFH